MLSASSPRSSCSRQVLEPMKPAPPLTSTLAISLDISRRAGRIKESVDAAKPRDGLQLTAYGSGRRPQGAGGEGGRKMED